MAFPGPLGTLAYRLWFFEKIAWCGLERPITVQGELCHRLPASLGGKLARNMPPRSDRVLVVDNNEEESQILASMLEHAGHRPRTTWSGVEALELLEIQEFDILLVSSYLPDLYVGDFLERFNRLPKRPCLIVMREGPAGACPRGLPMGCLSQALGPKASRRPHLARY
jgi:hypothetical protein